MCFVYNITKYSICQYCHFCCLFSKPIIIISVIFLFSLSPIAPASSAMLERWYDEGGRKYQQQTVFRASKDKLITTETRDGRFIITSIDTSNPRIIVISFFVVFFIGIAPLPGARMDIHLQSRHEQR